MDYRNNNNGSNSRNGGPAMGASSGHDYNQSSSYDQTQANTLANRRNSIDHQNHITKQRPITTYSSLIPPPSPTYFRLQEMGARMSTYGAPGGQSATAQGGPGGPPRGELDHLRPLDSTTNGNGANATDVEEAISWYQKLNIWMINEGNRVIFFGLWILVHIGLFGLAFFNFFYSDNFVTSRAIVGVTLPIARGAALVLHVDSGVILLPVCRTLISWLRSTPLNRIVPFDKAVTFHKAIAWSIVFFSFLHTFAHYRNFYLLAKAAPEKYNFWHLMFVSGPGWTGHIMLLVLVVMVATALPSVRMKKFEVFWYWHHLFLVFFFFFSFHGAFCLLTPDRPPYCKDISAFWKYWVSSGFIYLLERCAREWRAKQKTVISRVILHPSKVVEIQIKKDNCRALAGQYIFLCCPEVSLWQWHPFTLTSAPEEDYISVHMRVVGDFTKELSKKLGCDAEGVGEWEESLGDRNGLVTVLPRIMIDGPFGAASEDVFKYEVTVLVGAGIGVTPFASVLKSIWYRVNYPTKATKLHKVYFFWICRDKESFEWFQSLLLALESQDLNQFIEIHTFLTGRLRHSEVGNLMINEDSAFADTVTGLRARTCFGRPNMDMEFDRIRNNHPDTDIGVFFCGPKRMGKQLHTCCTKFSGGGTSFFWHKENF
ncbi:MAG: NADPH oxidase [Linnemannia gamsii]|nr:MAG: NADPH oxidase [Linnemannia gamsii]